jgi:hypothetical protein
VASRRPVDVDPEVGVSLERRHVVLNGWRKSRLIVDGSSPPAGPFTITVAGDLTSTWLTSMATLLELPGFDGPTQVRSVSECGPAFRARP